MKYYDSDNKRLICIESQADESYWNQHWEDKNLDKFIKSCGNHFVIRTTKKYLKRGSRIVDGGCGRGDKVYSLTKHGYDAYGIDYAKNTVDLINKYAPELNIIHGDVRDLPFLSESFDGYWSLGVIEHFYDGYDSIMQEMYRVLKSNGILFLTVPSMSYLRNQKAKKGRYPKWSNNEEILKQFYQFVFDPDYVISSFASNGFRLLEIIPYDGVKGLKEELHVFKRLLQRIYIGTSLHQKIIKKVIDLLVKPFTYHMLLYIFKKIKNE